VIRRRSPKVVWINRRSGVAHTSPGCRALAGVPARAVRQEAWDPSRPRRLCSICWGADRPRSRAFAGASVRVTERSEGNPRSGLTGADAAADIATERTGGGARRLRSELPVESGVVGEFVVFHQHGHGVVVVGV